MNNNNLMHTKNLKKDYHDGERTLSVLKGIDFQLKIGEVVAIVGQSGSGKSTLLNLLGALDRPSSGHIYLEDQDLAMLSPHKLNLIRREKMGLIFQFHHLIPELKAWGKRDDARADCRRAARSRETTRARVAREGGLIGPR